MLVVHNPGAGGNGADAIDEVRDALEDAGADAELLPVRNADITTKVEDVLDDDFDLVLVAGGDGTVNAVANALAGSGPPMAVVPLGTRNHFAHDAGIPQDTQSAVDCAVAGTDIEVDLGRVADRAFVNNASIGLYPDFVQARDDRERRRNQARWRASLAAAALTWSDPPSLRLRVRGREDADEWRTTPILFVGNNEYETTLSRVGRRKSLSGGELCLYVARRREPFSAMRLASAALTGKLESDAGLDVLRGPRFQVDADHETLDVSVDGEIVALEPPLDFRVEAGALRLRVPAQGGRRA